MALETETVLDRRRLRRRLSIWRGLAIVVGLFALGLVAFSSADGVGLAERNQIARISLEGIITEDRDQLKLLKRLAEAKHVAAVILFVNSPGGTTTGGEALFEAIRDLARTKPVVAQFGTVAASAAYIVGLASDHIVARGNSITGSVGVIFQWAEGLAVAGQGRREDERDQERTAEGQPVALPASGRCRQAHCRTDGCRSQRWFVGLVATRRGIDTGSVAGLEQGRVFSGREALSCCWSIKSAVRQKSSSGLRRNAIFLRA